MPVNVETPIATATANGVTTVFPYSFTVLQATDLVVTATAADGTVTTYTLNVDYTLAGVGTSSGSATFAVAPANGLRITLYRDSQLSRSTDYQQNGDLLSETLDNDFDRPWLALQEIFNGSKSPPGSIRAPAGETFLPLPSAAKRAGFLLGFDGAGAVALIAAAAQSATALALSLLGNGGSTLVNFLQDGVGAVLLSVQDVLRETVSTKRFGAKHDGVTDDTAAINAAITHCQGNGKALRVNAGVAMITTLASTGSLKMVGDGPASVLRHKAGYVGNMINVTGSGVTVSISDLTLDGQQTLQVANSLNDQINCSATGVNGGKPAYLVVDNVDFVNTAYRGIAFYGDNVDATREVGVFTRNRFRDGSTNAINTSYTPVDINLVNGVEATVDDNDFYFSTAPTLPGGRCAVVVAQTQTVTPYYTKPTITNNRMAYRGCNELASLGAIDLYIWTGNAVVDNNVLVNSTATAIKLKGNSRNLSVTNNKVDGYYGTGGALPTFPAITISNPNYGSDTNQFLIDRNQVANWNSGASSGVISVSTYDGSLFSKNVAITRNQLSGVTGIGIDIANCQDLTVSANEIDGQGTVVSGIRALQCDGSLRIDKNKVANPSLYHIYVDTPLTTTLDAVIDDNTLLGNNGTYAIYVNCRHALVRKNAIAGGFHGVNFGGTTRSAVGKLNTLTNMAGTVGLNVSSTTAVTINVQDNEIIDSPTITTNAFTSSASAPTQVVNRGNTWNGAQRTITTATATVGVNDSTLNFATSAGCTLTLPSAAPNVNQVLNLRNTAAFAITSASSNVVPLAGGAASTAILAATAGKWCQLQSDGTNWIIVAAN